MRKLLAALALFASAQPAMAQGSDLEEAADEACVAAGACRVVPALSIEGPDGTINTFEMGMTIPWLTQGNIMLTPGEAVTIALEEVEGILVPSLIATGDEARDTPLAPGQIRFDLGGYNRGRIMLSVLSQYPENIDYAAVKVTIGVGPDRTSVCTLMPGITVFESWQEPIYQLALLGFREAEEPGCKVIEVGGDLQSSQ